MATPEEPVACLKEHGTQDAALTPPAPDAAGGTAAVDVLSREMDPLYGNLIEITFFGNAADAQAYLDPSLYPPEANRERLADTVTVASYGSSGPPELEGIKTCLSHRQTDEALKTSGGCAGGLVVLTDADLSA